MPIAGSVQLTLGGDFNLIVWTGISEEFAALACNIIQDERLFLHPTEPNIYFIDGQVLTLPIARRWPKDGYRRPRWLPVCFRPVRQDVRRRRIPAIQARNEPRRTDESEGIREALLRKCGLL